MRGDREYGRFAMDGLLRELKGSKVCVAYQEVIPLLYDHQRALEIIKVNTSTLTMFPELVNYNISITFNF